MVGGKTIVLANSQHLLGNSQASSRSPSPFTRASGVLITGPIRTRAKAGSLQLITRGGERTQLGWPNHNDLGIYRLMVEEQHFRRGIYYFPLSRVLSFSRWTPLL